MGAVRCDDASHDRGPPTHRSRGPITASLIRIPLLAPGVPRRCGGPKSSLFVLNGLQLLQPFGRFAEVVVGVGFVFSVGRVEYFSVGIRPALKARPDGGAGNPTPEAAAHEDRSFVRRGHDVIITPYLETLAFEGGSRNHRERA